MEKGRYAVVPVVRAYINYLRNRTVNNDVGADDYATHRARLTSAKADMAEMEREQMKDNLIPADDVADAWDTMVSNMRSKLLSIPTKSATQTFAAKNVTEAKKILKEAVDDALEELCGDPSQKQLTLSGQALTRIAQKTINSPPRRLM